MEVEYWKEWNSAERESYRDRKSINILIENVGKKARVQLNKVSSANKRRIGVKS